MHQLGEKDIIFIGNLNNGINYDQLFESSISSNFDNMNIIGNGKLFNIFFFFNVDTSKNVSGT